MASLRAMTPDFAGRVIVAEPQPGPKWDKDPRMLADIREVLLGLDAEIAPFEFAHFGQSYPYGKKIKGLAAMPAGEPFVFFDTDTLITGDLMTVGFDFTKPAASMKREGTWPEEELYWPSYPAIRKSLYDKFGLEFESTLDLSQPDEYSERYMYFNAGWFYGADPKAFGERFLEYALAVRDDRPDALVHPIPRPVAGPSGAAVGDPQLWRRAPCPSAGRVGWRCDLPLPPAAAVLRPRKRPCRRGHGRRGRAKQD